MAGRRHLDHESRACPSDQNRGIRADYPVRQETRTSGASFAAGCDLRFLPGIHIALALVVMATAGWVTPKAPGENEH
jgi:hypothetical protein